MTSEGIGFEFLQNLRLFQYEKNNVQYTKHIKELHCKIEDSTLCDAKDNIKHKLQAHIVVQFITDIDWRTETALAQYATNWLMQTVKQQKLPILTDEQLNCLMQWLEIGVQDTDELIVTNAITIVGLLLKLHNKFIDFYLVRIFQPNNALFANRLIDCKNIELIFATIQCLDNLISCLLDVQEANHLQFEICEFYANYAMNLLFMPEKYKSTINNHRLNLFLFNCLSLLNRITNVCPVYAEKRTSEILGVAKAYMHYKGEVIPAVTRMPISQQTICVVTDIDTDAGEAMSTRTTGGKVTKTRKPRLMAKGGRQQSQNLQMTDAAIMDMCIFGDIKTSDSDASDTEIQQQTAGRVVNRAKNERHYCAKVRLMAIVLLGTVVRAMERHYLYGYWHALFPADNVEIENSITRDDLLAVAQCDPNIRCRSAALQVATQLLFGSKQFLRQAETSSKYNSTAFIPYTVTLGRMLLAIYGAMINILMVEASLPVLTQALKCFGVLVQSTTFQRLPAGYVTRFINIVRKLIYHHDTAIQVSALMVIEFLLTPVDITEEIAMAIGLTMQKNTNFANTAIANRNVTNIRLFDDTFDSEEFVESDVEEEEEQMQEQSTNENVVESTSCAANSSAAAIDSWLLKRIFQILDYNLQQQNQQRIKPLVTVRIQCLQVLSSLTAHLKLFSAHLPTVAKVLELSLVDPSVNVKLSAGRCLDSLSYQIAHHLLEKKVELTNCTEFWTSMLSITLCHLQNDTSCLAQQQQQQQLQQQSKQQEQLQQQQQHQQMQTITLYRVSLCDALSNIGVTIFEHLPQAQQMNVISLLSGICSDTSEELTLKASAVRALAVFVQYPSLQGNLVFVENVAELTLRLLKDKNLLVRIKANWSMGNISDALISNCYNTKTTTTATTTATTNATGTATTLLQQHERISDDLLQRLIKAATSACNDNDKVRCNAVRTLGNLLRLLSEQQLEQSDCRVNFKNAVGKLVDCIRAAGNAKVKWNSCYAIGNFMQNRALFAATEIYNDLDWQQPLYAALCHVIVHHANFKVRINASAAILQIERRDYFGNYYDLFWSSLLAAIQQTYNLDNFLEYNHRDQLQEQLCLGICHILKLAQIEDFPLLKKHLIEYIDIVQSTWTRVTNRMIPEKAAPLAACALLLKEKQQQQQQMNIKATLEQSNALTFIAQAFNLQ